MKLFCKNMISEQTRVYLNHNINKQSYETNYFNLILSSPKGTT